jgi:hypothetical protein
MGIVCAMVVVPLPLPLPPPLPLLLLLPLLLPPPAGAWCRAFPGLGMIVSCLVAAAGHERSDVTVRGWWPGPCIVWL